MNHEMNRVTTTKTEWYAQHGHLFHYAINILFYLLGVYETHFWEWLILQ